MTIRVRDVMHPLVTTVAEDESLALALQLMLWTDVRHVPVLRAADGRTTGVISERDILRAHQRYGEAVMGEPVRTYMRSPAVTIAPDAELADAASQLATKRLGCLPVMDRDELVGIITASDVLSSVARAADREAVIEETGEAQIASIMYPKPLLAHPSDSLILAVERMLEARVRHLCVVDGEQHLLGIISDRDLRRVMGDPRTALRSARRRASLESATVGRAMTPSPRALTPDEPVAAAVSALLTHRYGALPVVDREERVVGIVSYVDVLRHIAGRTVPTAMDEIQPTERERRISDVVPADRAATPEPEVSYHRR
jgi:CBS domain-containing protein